MRLIPFHRPSLVLTCALGAVYGAAAWLLPSPARVDDVPFAPTADIAAREPVQVPAHRPDPGPSGVQGGADLGAADGLHAGTWASNSGDTRAVDRARFIVRAGRTF